MLSKNCILHFWGRVLPNRGVSSLREGGRPSSTSTNTRVIASRPMLPIMRRSFSRWLKWRQTAINAAIWAQELVDFYPTSKSPSSWQLYRFASPSKTLGHVLYTFPPCSRRHLSVETGKDCKMVAHMKTPILPRPMRRGDLKGLGHPRRASVLYHVLLQQSRQRSLLVIVEY